MKTKSFFSSQPLALAAVSLGLLAPQTGSAFAEFARGEFLLHARASAEYDSNIGASERETSDWVFQFAPTLEYVRQAGIYHLSADIGTVFTVFDDNSDFDSTGFRSNLSVSGPHRPGQRNSFSARVGYNEYNRADEDIGDRLKTRVFDASLTTRMELTGKTAWRLSPAYSDRRISRADLTRTKLFTVGNELAYVYSEKLDIGLGYRYREGNFRGSDDRVKGHAYFVSATGELTPKVLGRAAVGWQKERRQVEGASERNKDSLFYQLALDWAATDKSTLTLSGKSDIDATPARQAVRTTEVALDWSQSIDEHWSASLGAFLGESRYAGQSGDPAFSAGIERKDDFYGLRGGVDYRFMGTGSAGLSLTYTTRSSDVARYDYDRFRAGFHVGMTF